MGERPVPDDLERGGAVLERLSTFSDAVFAIAMTLLVLDIPRPPEHTTDITQFLLQHNGKFVAYVISFWVIAMYWMGHHRLFRHLREYDLGVVLINLALLFCVAFLPYPSAILGDHADSTGAVVFYALCISVTGIVNAILSWYAVIYRHFTRPVPSAMAWYYVSRGLAAPAVFLLSIPVALKHPTAATYMWGLAFVVQPIALRIARRRSAPPAEPSGGHTR